MVITKISYRRTFNLGSYENETIEMTADVDSHESVTEVMDKLRVYVHNQSMVERMEPVNPGSF